MLLVLLADLCQEMLAFGTDGNWTRIRNLVTYFILSSRQKYQASYESVLLHSYSCTPMTRSRGRGTARGRHPPSPNCPQGGMPSMSSVWQRLKLAPTEPLTADRSRTRAEKSIAVFSRTYREEQAVSSPHLQFLKTFRLSPSLAMH